MKKALLDPAVASSQNYSGTTPMSSRRAGVISSRVPYHAIPLKSLNSVMYTVLSTKTIIVIIHIFQVLLILLTVPFKII